MNDNDDNDNDNDDNDGDEDESHENEGGYNEDEDASNDSETTTESSGYNTIASWLKHGYHRMIMWSFFILRISVAKLWSIKIIPQSFLYTSFFTGGAVLVYLFI